MTGLVYGSVCSGIEAATQAWHPLGWQPSFFSEIEAFPRAVLQHHHPEVPLHGDFTTIEAGKYSPIDLLVGGTPCQSFSIAGLRGGLGDDRGNLALEYLRLAERLRPQWLVWENVPGVLSSGGGRDFGSIIGGMAELGYGFAYRVLDAQYVRTRAFPWAVPQRRRRVFVVGYLGDWRRAAAVLFDRESLQGHPPPRREAGQRAAHTLSARPTGGGGLGTDFDLGGGLIANSGDVGYCLAASAQQSLDAETETLIATVSGEHISHSLRADGFDASEDATGRGTPIVAFGSKDHGADAMEGVSPTLRAGGHAKSHQNAGVPPAIAIQERAISENPNAGPDGAGVRTDGAAYTCEARTRSQIVAFQKGNLMRGAGSQPSDQTFPTLKADHGRGISDQAPCVAFAEKQRDEIRTMDVAGALAAEPGMKQQTYLAEPWAVRRLTPVECERLQGFPDDFTNIPWRGKDQAPDGPRYKALGNSMAVNVMQWIGERIQMVEDLG